MLVPVQTIELNQGNEIHLDCDDAKAIALAAAPRVNGQSPSLAAAEIDVDQWTLNHFRQEQPIFRFTFGDPDRFGGFRPRQFPHQSTKSLRDSPLTRGLARGRGNQMRDRR